METLNVILEGEGWDIYEYAGAAEHRTSLMHLSFKYAKGSSHIDIKLPKVLAEVILLGLEAKKQKEAGHEEGDRGEVGGAAGER